MKRKEKRVKKYRGHRTHGCGNIKNRRGSGNRGGVGNAGLNKHKKTWTVKYAPEHFGNRGFVKPLRKEQKVLNVFEIENMAKKEQKKPSSSTQPQSAQPPFSLVFEGKILGAGEITIPVFAKAFNWSKKAEEKIKQAGGQIEKIE